MEYHINCGLSKEEWELEKIVDQIKAEPSTLICIGILRQALRIHDVLGRGEQLKAFQGWQLDKGYLNQKTIQNGMVEEYLKSL